MPNPEPTFNYETYSALCNQFSASRKIGILDPHTAAASTKDPSTSFIVHNQQTYPLFVKPIYAPGYDSERDLKIVQRVVESPGIYPVIMVLPFGFIRNLQEDGSSWQLVLSADIRRQAIFCETNIAYKDTAIQILSELLGLQDLRPERVMLATGRNGNQNSSEPSMHLYHTLVARRHHPASIKSLSYNQTVDLYKQKRAVDFLKPSGVHVLFGSDFTGNESILSRAQQERLIETMWQIYATRFNWLAGDTTPVSLEDTREAFIEHMTNPGTTIITYFETGELKCFVYLVEDPSTSCFWLNGQYFKNLAQKIDSDFHIYFPGVVARSDSGGYMEKVITEACNLFAAAHANILVSFESTEVSSGYIPRLVETYVNNHPDLHCEHPILADSNDYRLYRVH